MVLSSTEGFAFKYEFKMNLEGIQCPFQSAQVSATPNGVEMNIEAHATDKIFDLIPKTNVQVFYRDWCGAEKDKEWRLMGDGYFSGFAKYDDASGARTISMVCRDFRMDIRKAPAVMVYQPDDSNLSIGNMLNLHGIKRTFYVRGKDALKKKILGVNRTYGGQLNMFSFISRLITGSSGGDVNKASKYIGGNNGRYFLDAFCRGIWLETTQGTTYGTFSNSRLRVEKKLFVAENNAGYRFFNEKYLNDFGNTIIMGGSMFSSVESVMMRMAAIFQTQPYSCSTPNLVKIEEASSDKIVKYLTQTLKKTFGEPYTMNSCMLLPPMHFTAPPNCNIIFPCMYNKITWQHDYDNDITRGYFKVANVLEQNDQTSKDIVSPDKQQREVPNSLMAANRGKDCPPLTIEERFKGVNIMYGDLEYAAASRNLTDEYAERVMQDPAKFKSAIAKLKQTTKIQQLEGIIDALTSGNSSAPIEELNKKLESHKDTLSKLKIVTSPTPGVYDVLDRHAVFKFLMNRFAGRVVNVVCDFNPYVVCGFPAIVMADDNRGEYKTLRTLIGFVQTITHAITAQGSAQTTIIMSHVRFIDEPTDIDDIGNPLFVGKTDGKSAKIDRKTFKYKDGYYFGQTGYPRNGVNDISSRSAVYDWEKKENTFDPQDKLSRSLDFAKDILLITPEGRSEGKTNLNFLDEKYTPNKIPIFYEQVFDQLALNHFMVGRYHDPNNYNNSYRFIYDSIHEAVEANLMSNEKRMNDYNEAINYVKRPVITEDEFYIKILGASFRIKNDPEDEDKKIRYANTSEARENNEKEDTDRWYGLPSKGSRFEQFTYPESGIIRGYVQPGDCSSVYEKQPVTPFLKEKREKAESYIQEVNARVASTR